MKPEDQKAFEGWLSHRNNNKNTTLIPIEVWEAALAHRDAPPAAAINEQILAHLKSAHSFIEETEAFGFQARDGILQCGNSIWNIDKSKAAIAESEKAKGGV